MDWSTVLRPTRPLHCLRWTSAVRRAARPTILVTRSSVLNDLIAPSEKVLHQREENNSMNARHATISALALLAVTAQAAAQFNSGSIGSYGPIDVTVGTVTLAVPDDGIFHCTTINVAA